MRIPVWQCQHCKQACKPELVKSIHENGSEHYSWRCNICARLNPKPGGRLYIPAKELGEYGFDLTSVPVVMDGRKDSRCIVCGERGAERHHWAPRHLFRDESDHWPTDYLCVRCHLRWHNTVTPGMNK